MLLPVERRLPAVPVGFVGRSSFCALYHDTFDTELVQTRQALHECFRVRYRVYCQEHHFLPAAAYPDALESDEYDSCSSHALLRYRDTGEVVATVRAVPGEVHGSLPLYSLLAEHGVDAAELPPVARTAEISRFAIAKDFRRRVYDGKYGAMTRPAIDDRRIIPHMTLGLIAMALVMSGNAGVDYVCAVMEPGLIRLLARFGIRWQTVGPRLEYHGTRQSCVASLAEIRAAIAAERPEILELMNDRRFCGIVPRRARKLMLID
jgi:N-acyl amino acid synthase of PEP-CTERM/exosortase system